MKLALETSTNVCSVVFCDDGGKIHEKRTDERGSHSELLFLFIEELMEEYNFSISDLEAVLVSEGPGSYTGLRIAASAIKGLLFQSDITLLSINTLASFATSAAKEIEHTKTIHSIIDARRVHVYHQGFAYRDGRLKSLDNVEVIPIEKFEVMLKTGDTVIGTGLNRLAHENLPDIKSYGSDFITAKSLITLADMDESGNFVRKISPQQFEPRYYTSNQAR